MAHLVEQLPREALVRTMVCLGVGCFRSYRRRLTLAKRYSEDFWTYFRVMLEDESTASEYRDLGVQFHDGGFYEDDDDFNDVTGIVITSSQRVMAEYRGLLGTICTSRAWLRGVDKYLAAFDSGFDEVRQLVSWDCKVP